jgi:hypothetical protein
MNTPSQMSRRQLMALTGAVLLLRPDSVSANARKIVVHKNPSCGCCTAWADHLRAHGFDVSEIETGDMDAVKVAAGVPKDLGSCHTAKIGTYVIEGHVPAHAIDKLLTLNPDATGLAVPGMPLGSPGMNGEPEDFEVVLFKGETRIVFGRYRGAGPS